jgi:hypothetical protein
MLTTVGQKQGSHAHGIELFNTDQDAKHISPARIGSLPLDPFD